MKVIKFNLNKNKPLKGLFVNPKKTADGKVINFSFGDRKFFIRRYSKLNNNLEFVRTNCKYMMELKDVELLPLYKNCIVGKPRNKNTSTAFCFIDTDKLPITEFKLNKCYLCTVVTNNNPSGKGRLTRLAFGVYSLVKDWSVDITCKNGIVIHITNETLTTSKLENYKAPKIDKTKKNPQLLSPKVIPVAGKSFFNFNTKKNKKDGYLSVGIFEVLCPKNLILEPSIANKRYIVVDDKTLKNHNNKKYNNIKKMLSDRLGGYDFDNNKPYRNQK